MSSNDPSQMPWRVTEIRTGRVRKSANTIHLSLSPTSADTYSNAQISDYSHRGDFKWRGRMGLTVIAHVEPDVNAISGTAGFGFWNRPFVPGKKQYDLPQAAWFFFAPPPNNMHLALGVPGSGWKAATIDAKRRQFRALLPTAPIGVLLMRSPMLYRLLWPIAQRAIGVSEYLIDLNLLTKPHTYTLDWLDDSLEFGIDGVVVHKSPVAPRGAMGFVAWIDNQYAIVKPQGSMSFGYTSIQNEQSLILTDIKLQSLIMGDEHDSPD